jgi:membrane-associated phospholipid phosphatase
LKYGDELIDLKGRKITIARVISRASPAPLINFYVGIVFSFYSPIGLGPFLTASSSLILCIILMVISPILPILYEAWRGRIDLDVSVRESRIKFFIFSLICYAFSYVIYWMLDCPIMNSLAAAYFTVTLGVALFSLRTKISVHAAGVGGPGTALIYVYGLPATPVILLWIAVVWARTTLKQHSISQSVAGILLGVIITAITYAFVFSA